MLGSYGNWVRSPRLFTLVAIVRELLVQAGATRRAEGAKRNTRRGWAHKKQHMSGVQEKRLNRAGCALRIARQSGVRIADLGKRKRPCRTKPGVEQRSGYMGTGHLGRHSQSPPRRRVMSFGWRHAARFSPQ
jgi:hypothetical protein